MTLIETMKTAREGHCDAQVAYLIAKENLRGAENLALDRRTESGKLGTNTEVRRSQIDSDCAAERTTCLDAELDLVRATSVLNIAVDSISPYAVV